MRRSLSNFAAAVATLVAFSSNVLAQTATPTVGPGNLTNGTSELPSQPTYTPNAFQEPTFTYDELLNLTDRFWDNFIFPANVAQAKSINSSLFSEDIIGRVDDTRVFPGRELNTEYLFGYFASLALAPNTVSITGAPINHTAIHFAATKNVVSSAQILFFNLTWVGAVVPVELDVWVTFNANGEMSQYDASVRWFAQLYDVLFASVASARNATATQTFVYLTNTFATSICETQAQYCNGTNQQYDSEASCIAYLTQNVRLGASYELGMNTILCRSVHQVMLPFRPSVHCPHVGPSGGGMCVDDLTYSQKVLQEVFVNSPFVPVEP